MAKKKTTYGDNNRLVKGKHRITVYLDPPLKKAVKYRALAEEKTLSEFATDAFNAALKGKG